MVDDAMVFVCLVRVATCQGMYSKLYIVMKYLVSL